jgi:hypothetical protein
MYAAGVIEKSIISRPFAYAAIVDVRLRIERLLILKFLLRTKSLKVL